MSSILPMPNGTDIVTADETHRQPTDAPITHRSGAANDIRRRKSDTRFELAVFVVVVVVVSAGVNSSPAPPVALVVDDLTQPLHCIDARPSNCCRLLWTVLPTTLCIRKPTLWPFNNRALGMHTETLADDNTCGATEQILERTALVSGNIITVFVLRSDSLGQTDVHISDMVNLDASEGKHVDTLH